MNHLEEAIKELRAQRDGLTDAIEILEAISQHRPLPPFHTGGLVGSPTPVLPPPPQTTPRPFVPVVVASEPSSQ